METPNVNLISLLLIVDKTTLQFCTSHGKALLTAHFNYPVEKNTHRHALALSMSSVYELCNFFGFLALTTNHVYPDIVAIPLCRSNLGKSSIFVVYFCNGCSLVTPSFFLSILPSHTTGLFFHYLT